MHSENRPSQPRENFLTVLLALLLGGACLAFLFVITLGFFSYVIAAVLAMVLVGYLHYALWGYSMSEETVAEREEELLRQRREAEEMEERRRQS